MKERTSMAALAALVVACGSTGRDRPAPGEGLRSTVTSSTSTAVPGSSAPPVVASAAPSASASAPVADAPLPRCDEYASQRPITFVATTSGSHLNLATNEVKLAPSLTAAQKDIDDFVRAYELDCQRSAAEMGSFDCPPGSCVPSVACDVVRNDGEILALHCRGMVSMGAHMGHTGATWIYERRGDAYVKLTLKEMFPGAGDDPVAKLIEAFDARGESARGGPSGDAFDEIYPYDASVRLASYGGTWNTWKGEVPLTRIADLTRCGPIGRLRQRSADTKGEGAEWPLEMTLDGHDYTEILRFHSADPRRAAVAKALDAEVASYVSAQKATGKTAFYCGVTLSTESLVSFSCGKGGAFTHRLADGSRVTVEELFASVSGSTKGAIQACYGRYLAAPKGAENYTQLKALPAMSVADFGDFTLAQSGVSFEVPMKDVTGGDTGLCEVPYATLSTSLVALAKPPAKPAPKP